jgi:adenylylsulfate kinase
MSHDSGSGSVDCAGAVVYVTGLPSSGKSTFAERAAAALRLRTGGVCVLDGDALRASLVPAHDYSPAGRSNFYATLARLAALLASQGLVVLVAATANRRAYRELARELAPAFLEVWVDTPQAECERRDTKGLYARARGGDAPFVPGAGEEYEAPLAPALVVRGGNDELAVARLVQALARQAS